MDCDLSLTVCGKIAANRYRVIDDRLYGLAGICMSEKALFDDWPEWYERWFTTPIGKLVKETESKLVHELADVKPGEKILDAGCGTGIFTKEFLEKGAEVVGLDISLPMLCYAEKKIQGYPFSTVCADMLCLPFKDNTFDKTISVTALEFIEDANKAAGELFRVTRPGGTIVVATLNSLSPWAARRKAKAGRHLTENAFFRSPDELLACNPAKGQVKTCVYFENSEEPARAVTIEQQCRLQELDTGAFVAACWKKLS